MDKITKKALELCDKNYQLQVENRKLINICEALAEKYLPGEDIESFLLFLEAGKYNLLLNYLGRLDPSILSPDEDN